MLTRITEALADFVVSKCKTTTFLPSSPKILIDLFIDVKNDIIGNVNMTFFLLDVCLARLRYKVSM